jgi:serine/threonine protein kinase
VNVVINNATQNNVLVDDLGAPRLCDFGRSRIIDRKTGYTTTTHVFNQCFTAPELIIDAGEDYGDFGDDDDDDAQTNTETDIARTQESDVYAFSMVAVDVSDFLLFFVSEMTLTNCKKVLSGKLPFGHLRDSASYGVLSLVKSGRRPKRSLHQHEAMTDDLWNLMQHCWAQQACERLPIGAVCKRLAQNNKRDT